MKPFKLIFHPKALNSAELIVNAKDYPTAVVGAIVEVFHTNSDENKLLLQIMDIRDDVPIRGTISIEQSVATLFQLRVFSVVNVNLISPESVILDSVELIFRDQYLGRSEMWRIKNAMINTCVYNNKKMVFCGGYTRVLAHEMWTKGEMVSCGVINDDTKVIFRCATSMVYIFIQMASEMWDFDYLGDTYFEKTVDGFLIDLFDKWKTFGSNHEVTLVVFSRVFYKANKLEEFPEAMRECLQEDYKNRFYEDFYRVVVQNERYEEWATITTSLLRRLFFTYKKDVLKYHHKVLQESGISTDSIPEAYLSSASEGNFLEVLNMALNVFEKHYIERSLDRTGQLVIVVSPGTGEFCVDRQLTNITKQRVIDNGVGIDLICVSQDPLYAVPLFLFQNRDESLGDDSSIPYWINSSFYRNRNVLPTSLFVPRILVPIQFANITLNRSKKGSFSPTIPSASGQTNFTNSPKDYMAFDDEVFQKNKRIDVPNNDDSRKKKFSTCSYDINSDNLFSASPSFSPFKQRSITPPPKNQYEFINVEPLNRNRSQSIDENPKKNEQVIENEFGKQQNKGMQYTKPDGARNLLNPFKIPPFHFKSTSNRRRWSHVFPKNNINAQNYEDYENHGIAGIDLLNKEHINNLVENNVDINFVKLSKDIIEERQNLKPGNLSSNVDWKSMVFPACLPITTDFFPDKNNLQSFHVFSNYNLLPEDVNAEVALKRAVYREPLSTTEVFYQMICQRLSQGFQLVVCKTEDSDEKKKNSILMRSTQSSTEPFIEMRLSIGRIVHIVTLCGSEILVTRYRPKFPYATFEIQYRYRFQAPDHSTYGISWISFVTEKLENYNWNYVDHYLCARGDMDYTLQKFKYWRFRMYLIPLRADETKAIMKHLDVDFLCDIYKIPTMEEQHHFTKNFITFIENWVNRIKRSTSQTIKGESDSSPCKDRDSVTSVKKSQPSSNIYNEAIGPVVPESNVQSSVQVINNDSLNIVCPELLIEDYIANADLVEKMCATQVGVGFVIKHLGLPENTFVSDDAVRWLLINTKLFNSRNEAVERLQEILSEGFICHASGDSSHPFIDGYYFYYFPIRESSTDRCSFPKHDLQAFQNEWVEVEVKQPIQYPKSTEFLMDCLTLPKPLTLDSSWEVPWYKEAHLEMDVTGKSNRVEWGHARYQSLYRCDQAYEIIAHWAAASGSVVADLIYNWARKAQPIGFLLVPLPADPFALPYTLKSDPLRGPVFVPLNLNCLLTDGKNSLFHEYPEDTWLKRLLLFQEVILYRFGFVICNSKNNKNNETESYHNQYIHLTGNMFVLILSELIEEVKEKNDSPDQGLNEVEVDNPQEIQFSPHMEYISRHVYHSVSKDNNPKSEKRVGFLWAWNHMVSRRWKWSNPATGDEGFQNKLLDDFRCFCSNKDDRLLNFWETCKNDYYPLKSQEQVEIM